GNLAKQVTENKSKIPMTNSQRAGDGFTMPSWLALSWYGLITERIAPVWQYNPEPRKRSEKNQTA
ncbi:MAG: hypothetical protein KAJ51_14580, partial [Thermoplasmata archaeon]|nr:hypothetical protein [Thermoplasmata archaeon]